MEDAPLGQRIVQAVYDTMQLHTPTFDFRGEPTGCNCWVASRPTRDDHEWHVAQEVADTLEAMLAFRRSWDGES